MREANVNRKGTLVEVEENDSIGISFRMSKSIDDLDEINEDDIEFEDEELEPTIKRILAR